MIRSDNALAAATELLFSYGTLQLEAVQRSTFGRTLAGTSDVMIGFRLVPLPIDDPAVVAISGKAVHTMATWTRLASDVVSGTVFAVTQEELRHADEYEVAAVKRVSVVLQSGVRAWVYVDASSKSDSFPASHGRDVEVRTAVAADAVTIIGLHFAAVHETAAAFYPPEVLDAWSKRPDEARYQRMRDAILKGEEVFVVAEDASGVVGFGSILPRLQELHAVYVHPKVGRHGVGSRILADLERLAIDRGVRQLHLSASVNAEAFYRHAGYEVIERGVFRLTPDIEMASVKLTKRLMYGSGPVSEVRSSEF
jgi:GNAT superfamily N-acetyltransferase